MTRDELATVLRASFRGPIVDADEWRPLADYIIRLVELQQAFDAEQVCMNCSDYLTHDAPKVCENGPIGT